MIISALVKRYEDTGGAPFCWQRRGVSYALDIDEDGCLLDIVQLETLDEKKRARRTFVMPKESPRSSGIKATFLCDNGSYFLGLDEKRGAEKFESARQLHLSILDKMDTPFANAIRAYFNAGIPSNRGQFIKETATAKKAAASAQYIFQVNGCFVGDKDIAIRGAWNAYCASESAETEPPLCIVTGQHTEMERVHGKIKIGRTAGGASFISVNKDSFASYGNTREDRAADVGKYAAFAYVTALNDLLEDKNHRRFIGDDGLVYWAEGGSVAEEKLVENLLDPLMEAGDAQIVADTVARIARGDQVAEYALQRKFYLLCLSPNIARISVRFFHVDNFGDLIRHIKTHYDRLEILHSEHKYAQFLPVWKILAETTVEGSAEKARDEFYISSYRRETKVAEKPTAASPLLGGQMLSSILTGSAYPLTLYNAILTRIMAGAPVNRTKAAVIKSVLMRNFNESEVTTVGLNEQSTHLPYVLGRLFSVLERLQEKANGSSTIRERFFASACANPKVVFPTLLNLSIHHSAKLDNPVFYERLKGELLARVDDDNPFPAALGLEGQGKFILGYYHQTQWFFTKKEKKEELVNE